MQGRRLEILREIAPRVSRVAYLTSALNTPDFREAQTAAETLGLQFQGLGMRRPDELEGVFEAIRRDHAEALWVSGSPNVLAQREAIVGFATENRLPLLSQDRPSRRRAGCSPTGRAGRPTSGAQRPSWTRS